MFIIGAGAIGLIIGIILTYCILNPKLKQKIEKDTALENYNKDLEQINEELEVQNRALETSCISANEKLEKIRTQIQEATDNFTSLKDTASIAADNFYQLALSVAQQGFDDEIDKIHTNLDQARNSAQEEYLTLLEDCVKDYQQEITENQAELKSLFTQLAEMRNKVQLAIDAAIRQEEIDAQANFYRLNISAEDLKDIQILREACKQLRNTEPVNKIIYKVYYEKPYTDLVGRVVGPNKVSGIYKITNLQNKKCYVGQAVDVAERWRSHIKRGVGADTPTRNKLYPAMLEIGVENFTFEILEECKNPADLTEKEKYWTDFYEAQSYGYVIKKG